MKVYIVVNFKTRKITRGMHKLVRTPTHINLKKKKKQYTSFYTHTNFFAEPFILNVIKWLVKH